MSQGDFFSELKRRNVYKVAVAYIVACWLIIQAASILFPAFDAPASAIKILVIVLVLGFPIALAFSGVFEITPEGIKRESEVEADKSIPQHTGRRIIALTVVLAIIAAGLFAFQRWGPKRSTSTFGSSETYATISEKSVAVLPFENLSDDKSNAYFAEGIQDEILTRLSKIAALKVISRTSTQKYKSAPDNLHEVGQQLGVANLLEGSVQKVGNAVHVNAQLIRAGTDEHLWAESYDRKLDDIFGVEKEVAQNIATALNAKLTGAEKKALAQKPTDNPAAYEAYLRGKALMWEGNEAALRAGIQSYEEAVRLDPQFALAWAGLASARSVGFYYGDATPAGRAAAEQSLAKAESLQPQLPEIQMARASFDYFVLKDNEHVRDILQIQVATQQQSDAITPVQSVSQSLAAILGERKERTKLGLSKYTAEAAEQAAEHRDKLGIARNVRDVAAVHSILWPEEKQTNLLAIGILTGAVEVTDEP